MTPTTRPGLLVAAALAQACGSSSASHDAGSVHTDSGAQTMVDAAAAVDAGEITDARSGAEGGAAADAPIELPDGSLCQISATNAKCLSQQTMIGGRPVAYQAPLGTPPSGGWPGVVYFQGSLVPGTDAFSAASTAAFGPINTTRLYAMGISSGGFMTSRMAVSYPGKFRALADHSGSYATCSDTCTVPTPLPSNHPPTLFLHGDTDAIVPRREGKFGGAAVMRSVGLAAYHVA